MVDARQAAEGLARQRRQAELCNGVVIVVVERVLDLGLQVGRTGFGAIGRRLGGPSEGGEDAQRDQEGCGGLHGWSCQGTWGEHEVEHGTVWVCGVVDLCFVFLVACGDWVLHVVVAGGWWEDH